MTATAPMTAPVELTDTHVNVQWLRAAVGEEVEDRHTSDKVDPQALPTGEEETEGVPVQQVRKETNSRIAGGASGRDKRVRLSGQAGDRRPVASCRVSGARNPNCEQEPGAKRRRNKESGEEHLAAKSATDEAVVPSMATESATATDALIAPETMAGATPLEESAPVEVGVASVAVEAVEKSTAAEANEEKTGSADACAKKKNQKSEKDTAQPIEYTFEMDKKATRNALKVLNDAYEMRTRRLSDYVAELKTKLDARTQMYEETRKKADLYEAQSKQLQQEKDKLKQKCDVLQTENKEHREKLDKLKSALQCL